MSRSLVRHRAWWSRGYAHVYVIPCHLQRCSALLFTRQHCHISTSTESRAPRCDEATRDHLSTFSDACRAHQQQQKHRPMPHLLHDAPHSSAGPSELHAQDRECSDGARPGAMAPATPAASRSTDTPAAAATAAVSRADDVHLRRSKTDVPPPPPLVQPTDAQVAFLVAQSKWQAERGWNEHTLRCDDDTVDWHDGVADAATTEPYTWAHDADSSRSCCSEDAQQDSCGTEDSRYENDPADTAHTERYGNMSHATGTRDSTGARARRSIRSEAAHNDDSLSIHTHDDCDRTDNNSYKSDSIKPDEYDTCGNLISHDNNSNSRICCVDGHAERTQRCFDDSASGSSRSSSSPSCSSSDSDVVPESVMYHRCSINVLCAHVIAYLQATVHVSLVDAAREHLLFPALRRRLHELHVHQLLDVVACHWARSTLARYGTELKDRIRDRIACIATAAAVQRQHKQGHASVHEHEGHPFSFAGNSLPDDVSGTHRHSSSSSSSNNDREEDEDDIDGALYTDEVSTAEHDRHSGCTDATPAGESTEHAYSDHASSSSSSATTAVAPVTRHGGHELAISCHRHEQDADPMLGRSSCANPTNHSLRCTKRSDRTAAAAATDNDTDGDDAIRLHAHDEMSATTVLRCVVVMGMSAGHRRRDVDFFRLLGAHLVHHINAYDDPHDLVRVLSALARAKVRPSQRFLALLGRRFPILCRCRDSRRAAAPRAPGRTGEPSSKKTTPAARAAPSSSLWSASAQMLEPLSCYRAMVNLQRMGHDSITTYRFFADCMLREMERRVRATRKHALLAARAPGGGEPTVRDGAATTASSLWPTMHGTVARHVDDARMHGHPPMGGTDGTASTLRQDYGAMDTCPTSPHGSSALDEQHTATRASARGTGHDESAAAASLTSSSASSSSATQANDVDECDVMDSTWQARSRVELLTGLKLPLLTRWLAVLAYSGAPHQQYLRPLIQPLLIPLLPHLSPPSFTRLLRAVRMFGSTDAELLEAIVTAMCDAQEAWRGAPSVGVLSAMQPGTHPVGAAHEATAAATTTTTTTTTRTTTGGAASETVGEAARAERTKEAATGARPEGAGIAAPASTRSHTANATTTRRSSKATVATTAMRGMISCRENVLLTLALLARADGAELPRHTARFLQLCRDTFEPTRSQGAACSLQAQLAQRTRPGEMCAIAGYVCMLQSKPEMDLTVLQPLTALMNYFACRLTALMQLHVVPLTLVDRFAEVLQRQQHPDSTGAVAELLRVRRAVLQTDPAQQQPAAASASTTATRTSSTMATARGPSALAACVHRNATCATSESSTEQHPSGTENAKYNAAPTSSNNLMDTDTRDGRSCIDDEDDAIEEGATRSSKPYTTAYSPSTTMHAHAAVTGTDCVHKDATTTGCAFAASEPDDAAVQANAIDEEYGGIALDIDVRALFDKLVQLNDCNTYACYRPLSGPMQVQFRDSLAGMRVLDVLAAVDLYQRAYPNALCAATRRLLTRSVLAKLGGCAEEVTEPVRHCLVLTKPQHELFTRQDVRRLVQLIVDAPTPLTKVRVSDVTWRFVQRKATRLKMPAMVAMAERALVQPLAV